MLPRLFAAASALLVLAPLALAQPADHPYFPLHVGDVWIHDVYGDPGGHRTTTVLGWEGEGDEAFWRVGASFAPFDGSAVVESECAVRIILLSELHFVEVTPLSGEGCDAIAPVDDEPALPTSGELEEVSVTTRAHTLRLASISTLTTAGFHVNCMRVAENVGVFSRIQCSRSGGGGNYLTERLVYAEVDETTYGVHPDEFFASYDPLHYMPLDVGNRWTYSVLQSYWYSPSSDTYLKDYQITEFEESTARHTLTLTRLEEGEVTATYSCEIWMDPSGRVQLSGPDECALGSSPSSIFTSSQRWSFRMIGASAFETYGISDIPYDLLTLSFFWSAVRDDPVSSPTNTLLYQSAHGIGLLHYDAYYDSPSDPFPTRDVYTLLYADTGEAVYGVNPVSNEGPATSDPAAPGLRAALYPNPAVGRARLALTLARPAEVTVEAYDLLGRRWLREALGPLPPGTAHHDLDLSGLASGVYVVNVRAGDADLVSRQLVVVD